MLKTRHFLANGISHFVLMSALAITLPIAAHAANVDVSTAGGTAAMSNGDTGSFSGAANTASNLTYIGGGTIGDGTSVILATTLDNVGRLELAGATTLSGAIGAPGHRLFQLDLGGTTTSSGNNYITNVNIGGNSLTLNGTTNVIANSVLGTGGALALGTGVNLTSTVTTGTTNTGTLTLGANSSLTGTAGSTNFLLNQVNLGANSSISSNVFATTTNLNGTASSIGGNNTGTTLNFASASGTVSGNVTDTTVNFNGANGATANIGGTLNATNLAFANNSTANITGASTITGNVTTAGGNGTGTLGINGNSSIAGNVGAAGAALNALNYTGSSNTLTLGGVDRLTAFNISGSGNTITYGIGAGSVLGTAFTGGNNTYSFAANNTAASVGGIVGPGVNLSSSATVLNTAAVTSAVAQRTRYVMGQNNNNTNIAAPASFSISAPVTGVTFLEQFNSSAGNGILNQLDAVALQNGYYVNANAAAGGRNASFANYLDNNVAGRVTDVNGNTVYTYLNNLDAQIAAGNNTAAQNTLQQGQAQPQTQLDIATRTANEEFLGVVDDRMFKTHTGKGNATGANSGDEISPGRSVWIEAFGGVGDQNSRDGYSGFNSRTGGVAVGADQQVGRNSLLGLAGSYAYSRVKSDDVDQKTTIDTYQGALYGQTYFTPQWFLMGQAGGAFNHYQGSRGIPAGGVGASSDYDGWGYFANAKTGYDLPLQDGFMLTPFAALTHIGNHLNSYTETGAGGLDLSVASSDPRTTTGRIGAQLAKNFVTGDRTILRPQIRLDYLHDFQRDDQATIANFNGTGVAGTFSTNGIIQNRNGIDAGLGLDIMAVDNLTFSANYNYQWRDGYNGNSGLLKAQYNF